MGHLETILSYVGSLASYGSQTQALDLGSSGSTLLSRSCHPIMRVQGNVCVCGCVAVSTVMLQTLRPLCITTIPPAISAACVFVLSDERTPEFAHDAIY